MKKIILIGLLLLAGCDNNVSQRLTSDKAGKVTINGKDCEVIAINAGDANGRILFVDCGPGSSSTSYQVGKQRQTVGQFTAPDASAPEPACSCSCSADPLEEYRRLQEIKKGFYK